MVDVPLTQTHDPNAPKFVCLQTLANDMNLEQQCDDRTFYNVYSLSRSVKR